MKESINKDILYDNLLNIFEDKFLKWLSNKEKKQKKELFHRVYKLSEIKFKWKLRDSWEAYFEHLVRTATIILTEFENPTIDKVILALLHDIYEDTSILESTLWLIYSKDICNKIKFISKNDMSLKWDNKKKAYFERLLKCTDETIIDVKLADRIDNLRTIWCWKKNKIIKKVIETRKYILPLAEKFNKKAYKILQNEIFKIEQTLILENKEE